MALSEELPPAIRRLLASIGDGSGRTLIIAGPEASGKSALLESVRERLEALGVRVQALSATYRERNTPYATDQPLAGGLRPAEAPEQPEEGEEEATEEPTLSVAGFSYVPPGAVPSRRGRGERQRGRVLGVPFAVRTRGVERLDAAEYWSELCERFAGDRGLRVAITLEDGTFSDDDSREFLLYLSERARLRPFLVVIVLDSSSAAFSTWEERLIGRPDVDWVRTRSSRVDPREASRLKRVADELPPPTRRLLLYTALLGGSVSEVQLARVARLTFQELADALLPATEARLVRIDAQKVVIPHPPWIRFLPELVPPSELRRVHEEIAEALEAMHPEPSLAHRRELARHQFAADPGPIALRYLLETAELSFGLFGFDDVDELLSMALRCVPSLPLADRAPAESELRLLRARALLLSGRVSEAEQELDEGIGLALKDQVPPARIEEWVEPMVPILQAVGPRPSLVTRFGELIERLEGAAAFDLQALFQLLVTEAELDRHRPERGRREAHRIGHLAWRHPGPAIEAIALLAVGRTRLDGSAHERVRAERFLRSAALAFAQLRRPELEQVAEEYRARLLVRQGNRDAALAVHLKSIPILQRLRMPALEAVHELGVAELLFDRGPEARGLRALKRARELIEMLKLTPPAPALLRFWLLEGRRAAFEGNVERAREYWSAVGDRHGPPVLPLLRAEALLRLAALELLHGREAAAEERFRRPETVALFALSRPEWGDWERRIRGLAAAVHSGGGAIERLLRPESA